ncbi:MAG: hypothetical protein ACR2J8_06090 [Thermomicrobiales bacterium]
MGLLFAFVLFMISIGGGMHPLVAAPVALLGGFVLGGGLHQLQRRG